MEKRSFFQKIFGPKRPETNGYKMFRLINNSSSTFYPWNGSMFDNDIVRSAIRPKVNAISKLTATHIRTVNGKKNYDPDPRIKKILKRPNPYMSMHDFLMKMVFQRDLNHNAFAYVQKDNTGFPLAVYPIPYSSVELMEKEEILFARFRFRTGTYITVPYEDCIHLRKDFNENDFYGEPGTKALENVMDIITTTDQGIVNAIKNSAVVRWIMKFKQTLQPQDVKKATDEFVKNYLSITNGMGAATTDPRYDVEPAKIDNFNIPKASQQTAAIERLQSYYGTSQAIIQNDFKEDQWNGFYEQEIEPVIMQLSDGFTFAFFSAISSRFANDEILFETCNLQYASMNTKLQLYQVVDRGGMTLNKWLEILNLPPVDDGDTLIRRLDTQEVKPKKDEDNNNKKKENEDGD